jgi:hypothetical protein
VSQTSREKHVYDVVYENVERSDPSTMHETAITSFYMARWQGVKDLNISAQTEHQRKKTTHFSTIHGMSTSIQN